MIDGIQIKVCGLTSLVDADLADACGVDYLGFNFFPKSPRRISLAQYRSMAKRIPERHKVAVTVEPAPGELAALRDAGLELFQVHFRHDIPKEMIEGWSREVGARSLWLAPKLPPAADVPAAWLGLAHTVLLDTFDESLFGGTGRVGDWPKFRRHREAHPKTTWILSGGLNPENVGAALAASGARFVDVNSGIESAPGVKDRERLKAFVVAVHRAASP
ncbi:MAG TPA: phosphoribosylanthranilate isomerase [Opitutaceae bacterium]|nr:phosphoribosylanthranilate isomerase [Opitutaceae bacterium]